MPTSLMVNKLLHLAWMALRIYLLVCLVIMLVQRKLLYFPTHDPEPDLSRTFGVTPWEDKGEVIGWARLVPNPRHVWLVLHGNGGQASDRVYTLSTFSRDDAVYIVEYPGYGARPGSPSRESFNRAAETAYALLRESYKTVPVNVFGESLGSGPSCHLASLPAPPDRLVLVVPFARLADVAAERFPFLPIHWLMFDRWNNIAALADYKGPVDIYGARDDTVIPLPHAERLAKSVAQSRFYTMPCGHNEWSNGKYIKLYR